jgi:hypothetical protein
MKVYCCYSAYADAGHDDDCEGIPREIPPATFLGNGSVAFPTDAVMRWPAHNRQLFNRPLFDQNIIDQLVQGRDRLMSAELTLLNMNYTWNGGILWKPPLGRMSGVVAEYYAAYEEAQEHAARMVWQSIQHGPDGAPDWLCEEFRRPSGSWYFYREGNRKECVSTDPFKWGKGCGEAGHDEGRCGNASCLKW